MYDSVRDGSREIGCEYCDREAVGTMVEDNTDETVPVCAICRLIYGGTEASIERGLAQSAAGDVVDLGDFDPMAGVMDDHDDNVQWPPT